MWFLKKSFIYLFTRDTQREAETQAEGEAGSLRGGEPDVGLDPRTPGSPPELKADAQPLSHPGALEIVLDFTKRQIKLRFV